MLGLLVILLNDEKLAGIECICTVYVKLLRQANKDSITYVIWIIFIIEQALLGWFNYSSN